MKKLFLVSVMLLINVLALPTFTNAAGGLTAVVNSIPSAMFQNETISASFTCTNSSGAEATNVGLQLSRAMEPFSSDRIGSAALTIFNASVDGTAVTPANASPYVDKIGSVTVANGSSITINLNLSQHPSLQVGDKVKVGATCVGNNEESGEVFSTNVERILEIKAVEVPTTPDPETEEEEEEEEEANPDDEKSAIASAEIPSEFTVSPDFSEMTIAEAKEVAGLSIENTDSTIDDSCDVLTTNNSIEWTEELDLSDDDLDTKFTNLDTYITLNKKGYVSIDTNSLPQLDGEKTITMTGLNLVDGKNVIILVDGEEATKSEVSNIAYANGTLTFDAESGSEFEIKPYLEVEECSIENGECVVTGFVNDLCAEVSIELSEGEYRKQTLSEDNFDDEEEGMFTYTFSDLSSSEYYEVKVTATNASEVSSDYEFNIGEDEESSSSLLWIILLLLLLAVAGGAGGYYYWKKKKMAKMNTEDKLTQEANSELPAQDKAEAGEESLIKPSETKVREYVPPTSDEPPLSQPTIE